MDKLFKAFDVDNAYESLDMDKIYRSLNIRQDGQAPVAGKDVGPATGADTRKVYKQVSRTGKVIAQESPEAANTRTAMPDLSKPSAKTASPALSKPAVPAASRTKTETVPESQDAVINLDLGNSSLLNGLILSEVLGRPKCMRRGRWY